MFSFSKSLVATTAFASNIEFLREQSYFAPVNAIKPLLHTWSLAVEEEFYLIFPLCLLFVRRSFLRWMPVIAIGVLTTSFLWSALHVVDAPARSFYLLQSRAWEILLGTLLALNFIPRPQPPMAEGLSFMGMGLILYAIFGFTDKTIFPGSNAMIPCLGATLSLYANRESTIDGRLLSSAPFVAIGLIIFAQDAEMHRIFGQMNGVTYISPLQTLCQRRACPILAGNVPLLWDSQHLTAAGSLFVVEKSVWPQLTASLKSAADQ